MTCSDCARVKAKARRKLRKLRRQGKVAAVKSRLSPNPAVLAYRNRVVAVDLVAIVVLSLYLVQRVASGGQILPTNGCGPKVTAANLPDDVQHSILDMVADLHSAYKATAKSGNPLSGVNVGVAAIASASCCATSSTATTTAVHLTGSGPALARQAAIAAGFTGDDVNIAVALAGAESGWNPAQLEIGSGHGHGLMQIDDRYHTIPSDWTDPVTNMRLAHDIFLAANSSWTPWVTYNTGAYKRFLDTGSTGTATVQTVALTRPACTTGPGTRGVAVSLASAGTGGGPVRQAAVSFALAQRGKPYVWGATGPSSYDCSGLIFAAYRSAGVSVPLTAGEQMMADTTVMPGQEQPGDQVFTELSEHDAGHTLLVIGSSQGVIHTVEAPHTGDVVKLYDVPEDGARIGRVQV